MEHKLIQGGEQYLPFARSRIKALRAVGLDYATQRFVLPDGTVRVQIQPGQDHIYITGYSAVVLSGVTQVGSIVTIPATETEDAYDVLRSYKPTTQAWTYVLKKDPAKSPSAFNDEALLAISAHADLGVSGSQYQDVCPSMYSGLMAQAVQVILGLGKTTDTTDGVKLRYNFRHAQCHVITTDSAGALWLVEIGSANGVIAMPLPIVKNSRAATSSGSQDVLRECGAKFKGIPSGRTFPADITEAIADGTVIRLATAADLNPFYSKTAYTETMGWSVNLAGSVAHNTCYTNVAGVVTGYHYKIDIEIAAATAEQPEPSGTAALSLVESGPINGASRFRFWDQAALLWRITPSQTWTSNTPTGVISSTPIFVCHVNDELSVVRHIAENRAGATTGGYGPVNVVDNTSYSGGLVLTDNPLAFTDLETTSFVHDTYVASDLFAGDIGGNKSVIRQTSLISYASATVTPPGIDYTFYEWERVSSTLTDYASVGSALRGSRDGYSIRTSSGGTGTHTINSWRGDYTPGGPVPLNAAGISFNHPVYTDGYITTSSNMPGNPTIAARSLFSGSSPAPQADTIKVAAANLGTITSTETYSNQSDRNAMNGVWRTGGGFQFHFRHSVFGDTPHYVRSKNVTDGANIRGFGSMLPASYTDYRFSFVGYI